MAIHFYTEDTTFKLRNSHSIKNWLKTVVSAENYRLNSLTYIFCSDNYLLGINQTYLNHDEYTDVVTFDESEDSTCIEGEIYISVDRVAENAQLLNQAFEHELHRVMVHGLLHLLGYDDLSDETEAQMRLEEDKRLALYEQMIHSKP